MSSHKPNLYFFSGKIVNDDFGPTLKVVKKLLKVDEILGRNLHSNSNQNLKIYLEHGDEKVFNEVWNTSASFS